MKCPANYRMIQTKDICVAAIGIKANAGAPIKTATTYYNDMPIGCYYDPNGYSHFNAVQGTIVIPGSPGQPICKKDLPGVCFNRS